MTPIQGAFRSKRARTARRRTQPAATIQRRCESRGSRIWGVRRELAAAVIEVGSASGTVSTDVWFGGHPVLFKPLEGVLGCCLREGRCCEARGVISEGRVSTTGAFPCRDRSPWRMDAIGCCAPCSMVPGPPSDTRVAATGGGTGRLIAVTPREDLERGIRRIATSRLGNLRRRQAKKRAMEAVLIIISTNEAVRSRKTRDRRPRTGAGHLSGRSYQRGSALVRTSNIEEAGAKPGRSAGGPVLAPATGLGCGGRPTSTALRVTSQGVLPMRPKLDFVKDCR